MYIKSERSYFYNTFCNKLQHIRERERERVPIKNSPAVRFGRSWGKESPSTARWPWMALRRRWAAIESIASRWSWFQWSRHVTLLLFFLSLFVSREYEKERERENENAREGEREKCTARFTTQMMMMTMTNEATISA